MSLYSNKNFSFTLLHLRINVVTKKRETKKIFQREGALRPCFWASIYVFFHLPFLSNRQLKKTLIRMNEKRRKRGMKAIENKQFLCLENKFGKCL